MCRTLRKSTKWIWPEEANYCHQASYLLFFTASSISIPGLEQGHLGEYTQLCVYSSFTFNSISMYSRLCNCNVHYHPNRNSLFCWNDTNILENNLFKAYNSERSSYLLPVIYSLTVHMRKLTFNISRMIITETEKPCFFDFSGIEFWRDSSLRRFLLLLFEYTAVFFLLAHSPNTELKDSWHCFFNISDQLHNS